MSPEPKMAFEMRANTRAEKIDYHEEPLLQWAADSAGNFSQLSHLWDRFYDSPKISPMQAHELVHELLKLCDLASSTEDNKWVQPIALRLARFFSFAYTNTLEIICISD